ncbi:MAG: peroxiredoxin family protein [Actinomycetota bacterium]|nr:peroxiredoxin family protein [Actinomycetota bacterium]
MRSHSRPHPPDLGDLAPSLELPTLAGGGFRLEDERGRPVLLTFLRHAG